MYDGCLATGSLHGGDETAERLEVALVETRHRLTHLTGCGTHHADAHFHGHRHVYRRAHRRHALGDTLRLPHQTGTEGTARDAVARAAAVEVDLVESRVLARARSGGEFAGFAAPELQCERMLLRIELEQPRPLTPQDRSCGDHLGVEQHVGGEPAEKIAAMTIGPVHHRSDRDPSVDGRRLCGTFGHLRQFSCSSGWGLESRRWWLFSLP